MTAFHNKVRMNNPHKHKRRLFTAFTVTKPENTKDPLHRGKKKKPKLEVRGAVYSFMWTSSDKQSRPLTIKINSHL